MENGPRYIDKEGERRRLAVRGEVVRQAREGKIDPHVTGTIMNIVERNVEELYTCFEGIQAIRESVPRHLGSFLGHGFFRSPKVIKSALEAVDLEKKIKINEIESRIRGVFISGSSSLPIEDQEVVSTAVHSMWPVAEPSTENPQS